MDVPAELDAIVMRALERDPQRRYECAADMARDLNEFVLSARLRSDQIVEFVRDVQIQLARERRSLPVHVGIDARPLSPWDAHATRCRRPNGGPRVYRGCAISFHLELAATSAALRTWQRPARGWGSRVRGDA